MKGNWLKTFGVFLCIFLVSTGCANPSSGGHPNPEDTLDRLILSSGNDQPISGAIISLSSSGSGNTILGTATTNASGKFRLEFPSGQDAVDVYITAEGFDDYSEDGWSKADWDSGKTIKLTPVSAISTGYTTTVTGIISDFFLGEGVEEATVVAVDADTGHTESAITDASGHYSLTINHDGDFALSIGADGYFSETIPVVTTSSRSDQNCAMFQRIAGETFITTVSGYIKDSQTNTGMGNVTVTVSDDGTEDTDTAITNDDGYYYLTITHSGEYKLEASAPGYIDYETEIATTKGDFYWDCNLTFDNSLYTTVLSGYIIDSDTGYGIKNAVVAAGDEDTLDTAVTITDSEGYYSLSVIHDGDFSLGGSALGYLNFETEISTIQSTHSRNLDLATLPAGTTYTTVFSGYILDPETGMGIEDALVGVQDMESFNDNEIHTDSDGYFTLELSHSGTVLFEVETEGFYNYEKIITTTEEVFAPDPQMIKIIPGKTFTTVIYGYITDMESGMPIERFDLYAWDEDTNGYDYAETDSTGYFSMEIHHDGEFELVLHEPGYPETVFTISTIASAKLFLLSLWPPTFTTVVSGTVSDTEGSPVEGAVVRISETGSAFTNETVTDSNGHYTITAIHSGGFALTVTADGYQSYDSWVSMTGSTWTKNYTMLPPLTYSTEISGYIKDINTFDGIPDAIITISDPETGNELTATSEIDGFYEATFEHEGVYSLTIEADGYDTITEDFTTTSVTSYWINYLTPTGSGDEYTTIITGTVTDFDSMDALQDVTITAYHPTDPDLDVTATTDINGEYSLTFIHDGGEFLIYAAAAGYEDEGFIITTTESNETVDFELTHIP